MEPMAIVDGDLIRPTVGWGKPLNKGRNERIHWWTTEDKTAY